MRVIVRVRSEMCKEKRWRTRRIRILSWSLCPANPEVLEGRCLWYVWLLGFVSCDMPHWGCSCGFMGSLTQPAVGWHSPSLMVRPEVLSRL